MKLQNSKNANDFECLLKRMLCCPGSGHKLQVFCFSSLPLQLQGITEPLTQILKKYDITVCCKQTIDHTTLQQFSAPKFRPSLDSQANVVYKIPCANCLWCYTGDTSRAFNTRKKTIYLFLETPKPKAQELQIMPAWLHNHSITLLKKLICH